MSSGSTLELFGGALFSGANDIVAGETLEIGSGYTLSGFIVSSGVTLEVASSGFVSDTTVLSGGTLLILCGGRRQRDDQQRRHGHRPQCGQQWPAADFSSGQISNGVTVLTSGELQFLSGGAASGTTLSGGHEFLSSGGTASGVVISSGGQLWVFNGADLEDFTLQPFGLVEFISGYTLSGFTVANSATVYGRGCYGRRHRRTDGGGLSLGFGGVASGTVVSNGGSSWSRWRHGQRNCRVQRRLAGGHVERHRQRYDGAERRHAGRNRPVAWRHDIGRLWWRARFNVATINVGSGQTIQSGQIGSHSGIVVLSGGTMLSAVVSSSAALAVEGGLAIGTVVSSSGQISWIRRCEQHNAQSRRRPRSVTRMASRSARLC